MIWAGATTRRGDRLGRTILRRRRLGDVAGLLIAAVAVVPSSAVADGGRSIASAPAVVYRDDATVATKSKKPKISLALPTADAGATVPFSWTAARVKRNHRLVLQRQVGTGRVWRTMRHLSKPGGAGQLPAFALGSYPLRIAVLGKRKVIVARQERRLYVYGQVPLSTLFRSQSDGGGVYTLPTSSFTWALADGIGFTAQSTIASVKRSPCRSIHVDAVLEPRYVEYSHTQETATVSIVQESRDAVSTTVPVNVVRSLDVPLVVGQSWSINVVHQDAGVLDHIFINGSGNCYSAEDLSS